MEPTTSIKSAVVSFIRENGPHTAEDIARELFNDEELLIHVQGHDYEFDTEHLSNILAHSIRFVQDDAGRFHLTAEYDDTLAE